MVIKIHKYFVSNFYWIFERRYMNNIKKQMILDKLNLVINKLMNLGEPENEKELEGGGEAIGFFRRDFGIQEWDWPQGVGLYGLLRIMKVERNSEYKEFLYKWFKDNMKAGLPSKNINTTTPLLTLVELNEMYADKEFEALCLEWADWLMNCLPRTKEGGFQHVTSANGDRQGVRLNENEMWIDTIFMTILFLNKMGQKYKKQEWIDESIRQVLMHIKYLYDKKSGLFYHGWTFNERNNFGGIFWCRGNSWFTLGILDYVDMFKGTLNIGVKEFIVDTYKAQVSMLKKLQSKGGLWHTVLTDPSSYEEVSGSAAIVAGILKGIRHGILDDTYLACAERGILAILDNIDKDGTVSNVSGGTGMGYDAEHYKNILIAPMAYGQSLTILALAETLMHID
jgi:unsaturated rhamnogalacturonyl hydrolase